MLNEIIDFEELVELKNPFADIKGENGPVLWREILEKLNNPGAIVAGGAVRDYLLGVEPKDIDIFVPASNFMPPGVCFDSLFRDEKKEEYEALNNISIVMRGSIAGFTIDLIGVEDFASGAELAKTFDFGISRSWFDGDYIGDAVEAQRDRQSKTVTLLIDDRRERAERRFARFNERMGGDWTFVA